MDNNFKTITLPLGAIMLTAIVALGGLIGYSHSLLREDIATLRADMTNDIAELRADMTNDIAELRADVTSDINGLRREMSDLRREVVDMRGELGSLRERVARVEVLVEGRAEGRTAPAVLQPAS